MAISSEATSQTRQPDQIDLKALKARQQGAWSSGDYAVVGTTLQIVGEELCEALDIRSGHKVLDVAAGNGNVSLAAARRWCDVTATDYVPALLDRARERAAAERLDMTFREADAEALPFQDASFDVVVSTFGVMFTPDQDRAAREMVRVCRRGGKIGLANWTPGGFIGQLFKTIGKHLPPPAGAKSPALWGTRERIGELFEANASSVKTAQRNYVFRYPLRGALAGNLQDLLRSRAQGVRPPCSPRRSRPSRRTSRRSSLSSIAPAMAPWSCRASTWRSSSPAAEQGECPSMLAATRKGRAVTFAIGSFIVRLVAFRSAPSLSHAPSRSHMLPSRAI
jgi:ubiquinone/menaquinone biosynthesis C-methylase UbiE